MKIYVYAFLTGLLLIAGCAHETVVSATSLKVHC